MKRKPKTEKHIITQQGLESSLLAVLEFGYKACERGLNIQAATAECLPAIKKLVGDSNLPRAILVVHLPKKENPESEILDKLAENHKRKLH